MRGVEVSESAASDRAPAGASRGERSLVTGQQTAGPVRTCPAAAAVTSVDRSIAGAPCGLARLAFDCKVASCTIIELTPWTVDENASTFHLCSYSAPDGGAEYCDERVCLSLRVSVCVSLCVCVCVCLSVRDHIFGNTRPIFTNFLCMLPMTVARSSSGGVVTCCVLPVYRWRYIYTSQGCSTSPHSWGAAHTQPWAWL